MIIGSHAELKPSLDKTLAVYEQDGLDAFVTAVHKTILRKKIRYPILEFAAQEFFKRIPPDEHIAIADRIIALKENGSEVIAGKS